MRLKFSGEPHWHAHYPQTYVRYEWKPNDWLWIFKPYEGGYNTADWETQRREWLREKLNETSV